MKRKAFHKRFGGLLLALVGAFAFGFGAVGCDGGTPSGLASGGASTGGGGGGGGGTSGGPRIVAFKLDNTVPVQGDVLWVFLNDDGTLDLNTLDLLINGTSAAQSGTFQVGGLQLNKGIMLEVDPAPSPGDTIQATVDNTSGTTLTTNTITVQAAPFAPANLPGGGFQVTAPTYGASGQGNNPAIIFDHSGGQAPSYLIVIIELDPNAGSITDIPVAVEVPSGTWTVDAGLQNPGTEYANAALANPGDFLVHAVPLDQSGYGVGTSVDVAGYNTLPPNLSSPTQAQWTIINTWPYFTSN